MTKTKLLTCLTAALLLAASAGASLAHTMVRAVSIAEGAVLASSPPSVTITFDHPAGMGAVRLETATGERVPIAWTPPRTLSASFIIPLPRLDPDRYRLTWRVVAQDGHVMAGAVNFSVAASPPPTSTSQRRP
jgi:methionine-rich copper-binding protein CopC